MEIASGMFKIESDFYGRMNNLHLLVGDGAVLLVDTGVTETIVSSLVPALARLGVKRIDYIVNTHADLDHCGGNGAVAELFPGAVLVCQQDDQAWINDFTSLVEQRYDEYAVLGMPETQETKQFLFDITASAAVTRTFADVLPIDLGGGWIVELRHAPGHSPGHLCVWDPRSAVSIIGDAVLLDGLYMADGAPAFPPTYRYVRSYEETIAKIRSWGPAALATAHYPDPTEPAHVTAFLDTTQRFVQDCRSRLLDALDTSEPKTLRALIDETGPQLGPWDAEATNSLKFPILGHLEELEATGDAVRRVIDAETLWSRA